MQDKFYIIQLYIIQWRSDVELNIWQSDRRMMSVLCENALLK